MREMLKSKLHHATVTSTDLHYVGSITLDPVLMRAADILPNEKVEVLNINNGARFQTYAILGEEGSGACILNGPAARLVTRGDVVIVLTYTWMDEEKAQKHSPKIVVLGDDNTIEHRLRG